MGGKKKCPVFIEPDQWARLCEYWMNPETEQKALRMANARKAVKKQSNVGRAGKAGKEAVLVSVVMNLLALVTPYIHFSHCCLKIDMTIKLPNERPHVFDSRRRRDRGVPGSPS